MPAKTQQNVGPQKRRHRAPAAHTDALLYLFWRAMFSFCGAQTKDAPRPEDMRSSSEVECKVYRTDDPGKKAVLLATESAKEAAGLGPPAFLHFWRNRAGSGIPPDTQALFDLSRHLSGADSNSWWQKSGAFGDRVGKRGGRAWAASVFVLLAQRGGERYPARYTSPI